jgi:hypothetical protein
MSDYVNNHPIVNDIVVHLYKKFRPKFKYSNPLSARGVMFLKNTDYQDKDLMPDRELEEMWSKLPVPSLNTENMLHISLRLCVEKRIMSSMHVAFYHSAKAHCSFEMPHKNEANASKELTVET